jgi:hypothetical protein
MNWSARGLRLEHARVRSFHERQSDTRRRCRTEAVWSLSRSPVWAIARNGPAELLRWRDQSNPRYGIPITSEAAVAIR